MTDKPSIKKIGILTGGGDCPGLNPVIRGLSIPLMNQNIEVIGIMEGWRGMVKGMHSKLERSVINEIGVIGGTVLGSSRTNPYRNDGADVDKVIETYRKLELDALVTVGGDDTLEIASFLSRDSEMNVVGVPKTIDNDVPGTDFTFGFMSAVENATTAFDSLRTTAMSHRRTIVVECMGRHAGWITAYAGLASQCDFIAVPEKPCKLKAIAAATKSARAKGRNYNLIAIAEGASIDGLGPFAPKRADKQEEDAFGNVVIAAGELGDAVARGIEALTDFETRSVTLGHLQRGGAPCAFDRVLGTQYGQGAARAVLAGEFGVLIAFVNNKIVTKPLAGTLRENQNEPKKYKLLDAQFLENAEEFFG